MVQVPQVRLTPLISVTITAFVVLLRFV